MENAKIQKFKYDILSNFQTMWKRAFDKHLYKTKYETLARFARNYDVLILGFAAIWERFFFEQVCNLWTSLHLSSKKLHEDNYSSYV